MSRHIVLALLLCASAFAAACGADDPVANRPTSPGPAASEVGGQVMVQGVAFRPREITVAVGEDVTWTFEDGGLGHTVTADDASFDSGERSEGAFVQTFSEVGEVAYHCERHAAMHGVVTVEAATS